VHYFRDGTILGSEAFVEGIFEAQREQFSPKRKQGARRIREASASLDALRRLQIRPLG
jgi:putative transposase